jgi:hypothetical protein
VLGIVNNLGLSSANTFIITSGDITPPVVTLTTPPNGSQTNDTTPTFGGVGGTASGDSTTVTIKIYPGTTASGTPVQTLYAGHLVAGLHVVNWDGRNGAGEVVASGGYIVLVEAQGTGQTLHLHATDTDGEHIKLKRARLCIYWSTDVRGFMGLASNGPTKGCRIGPPADITLRNITIVIGQSRVGLGQGNSIGPRSINVNNTDVAEFLDQACPGRGTR